MAGLPNPGMKIDLSNTALVFTDPQNDFLSPKGVTLGVVVEVTPRDGPAVARVVDAESGDVGEGAKGILVQELVRLAVEAVHVVVVQRHDDLGQAVAVEVRRGGRGDPTGRIPAIHTHGRVPPG